MSPSTTSDAGPVLRRQDSPTKRRARSAVDVRHTGWGDVAVARCWRRGKAGGGFWATAWSCSIQQARDWHVSSRASAGDLIKAQGSRHKAQGTRLKAQGTRLKSQNGFITHGHKARRACPEQDRSQRKCEASPIVWNDTNARRAEPVLRSDMPASSRRGYEPVQD